MLRCISQIAEYDQTLHDLTNAMRQLASSVGVVYSANHSRTQSNQVHHSLRLHGGGQGPRRMLSLASLNERFPKGRYRFKHQRLHPSMKVHSEVDTMPEEFESLAMNLTSLLKCLEDVGDVTDLALTDAIMSFEGDLKVGQTTLSVFLTLMCFIPVLGIILERLQKSVVYLSRAIESTYILKFREPRHRCPEIPLRPYA
jgi:hypothetical protein